ncbi:uncharacterized protein [Primulina eburnea]|uniref:uncharacterized protein n=1 Tax=Primulina eburnea TaxID=1245227 RepID=UPI003C6C2A35
MCYMSPFLFYNLLSISKLTFDLKCQVIFLSSHCESQDLTSKMMIVNARQDGGLYSFATQSFLGRRDPTKCLNSVSHSSVNDILLLRSRLGHPNFSYLKRLFPKFINKNIFTLHSEFCELAIHHSSIFPSQAYKRALHYHVDGFRFDLASVLCRGTDGSPLNAPPLIREIAKDTILSRCKIIAEPWDCGGLYLVGRFPNWDRLH